MRRVLILCLSLFTLSGCATLSYPLPKCDGYAKRPLNRSMWDWEADKAQSTEQQSLLSSGGMVAMAFTEQPPQSAAQTAAFAGFDEAGSYAACRAG